MIGKAGAKLDIAKLDELCQERKLQRLQNIRNGFNLELNEIAGKWILHSKPVTRPYGVQREGEAYDVWHHILHQVHDPPEIKRLWEVSAVFRDIMRGNYIATRLPEIVKLISDKRPQYWEYPEVPEWFGEDDKERSDRNVRVATFLNLRLLSKQCRMSVEDICHSEKCYRPNFDIWNIEDLRRIRQKLEEDPSIAASHFPGFVVSVGERYVQGNIEPFRQAITDCLELVGHKIRTFDYYPVPEAYQDTYNRLRAWASLMPNMEEFYFDLGENDEDAQELEGIPPFPKLPLLRSIEEGSVHRGNLPSPFMQRIMEACTGIQDVQIFEGDHERDRSPQMLVTLSNLTSLRLFPYYSLLEHRNLPWKLKKLNLGNPNSFLRTTVSSCSLFAFLKQFEETLENLEFHMVDFFNCPNHGYLDLKNLKMLKMYLHESYKNLNFLLYAEMLETLEISVRGDYCYAPTLTMREEAYRRIISGSFLGKSMWNVFPYLKWYKLHTAYYSERNGNERRAEIEEFREGPQAL